ncbi:MAG: ribonuclease III [Prevotellaceae bacterium]|nr:ribonuclease III [Prevotellaceae bacterium]
MFSHLFQRGKKLFSRSPKSEDELFIASLREVLGYTPKRLELYHQAFTHSSARVVYHQHQQHQQQRPQHQRYHKRYYVKPTEHNERLEFLGDAVLELIVSEYLYNKFSNRREGFLTQVRSKIVGREALEKLAQRLDLARLVKAKLRNTSAKNILGNTLEALMGAVYLDKGYAHAREVFINRMLLPYVNIDDLVKREIDFKSRLLEVVQKRGKVAVFDTVSQQGKDKASTLFNSTLRIDGEVVGQGSGLSKKEAEQRAAEKAYTAFSAKRS